MNYNKVKPATQDRIKQIKYTATEYEPFSWSNYDVLSLIKAIEILQGTYIKPVKK